MNPRILTALFIVIIGIQSAPLCAQSVDTADNGKEALTSPSLDDAIERVIARPEYSWRLPRDDDAGAGRGFIGSFIHTLSQWFADIASGIADTVSKWWERLRRIFKWDPPHPRGGKSSLGTAPKTMAIILMVIICILLVILLMKIRKKRRSLTVVTASPSRSADELLADDSAAFDLPSDQWIALALELMNDGDFRKAMRAMFFASLAHLAATDLISIAKCKSNRDYTRELCRRAHDQRQLLSAFEENVRLLERVWYGTHTATLEMASLFTRNKDVILNESA